MKLFSKKENSNAALTVVGEQAVPEASEEKKTDGKKIGKIVVGAAAGAAALAIAVYKVVTGKKPDGGYTELPGSDAESAPTAAESDFAEV